MPTMRIGAAGSTSVLSTQAPSSAWFSMPIVPASDAHIGIAPIPAGTSYTDPGLVNDRTYGYALVAVDTRGNRSEPVTAGATPTDLTPPPAPTGGTATAGDRQAVVGWDAGAPTSPGTGCWRPTAAPSPPCRRRRPRRR